MNNFRLNCIFVVVAAISAGIMTYNAYGNLFSQPSFEEFRDRFEFSTSGL